MAFFQLFVFLKIKQNSGTNLFFFDGFGALFPQFSSLRNKPFPKCKEQFLDIPEKNINSRENDISFTNKIHYFIVMGPKTMPVSKKKSIQLGRKGVHYKSTVLCKFNGDHKSI